MSHLFTVTAPLSVRLPDGEQRVVAELCPLDSEPSNGLVFFDPYWHLSDPETSIHVLHGTISGEGPWKCENHLFTVVGCQGSNPEQAQQAAQWQVFLQHPSQNYPSRPLIAAIARRFATKHADPLLP